MKYQRGQIGIMTAIIAGAFTLSASIVTAWGVASRTTDTRISEIDTQVQVVEERENNHYLELRGDLGRIEDKLDRLLEM